MNVEDKNKTSLLNDEEVNTILNVIKNHRENAYRKVNEELVSMYWEVGKYLSTKVRSEKWGAKVIDSISKAIIDNYPNLKGFDRSGLFRMMQFYETYSENEIVAPLVRQISWTNNIIIFSHKSSIEEKEFYIRSCIKNNYSKRELQRQISSNYYERYMISGDKALMSVEKIVGEEDCPNTRILDVYSLEFLDLPENYKEKDLRDQIVDNMKDFILEIGKDFTFVGKEYRLAVGNSDFYIDLVFFNRSYNCLVAVELKTGSFIPEYISKMNFYLEALDRQVKKENENPSIGIILCASKDKTIVEYSMSRNISPIGISNYSIKLIDKKLLENKLKELSILLDK